MRAPRRSRTPMADDDGGACHLVSPPNQTHVKHALLLSKLYSFVAPTRPRPPALIVSIC